MNQVSVGVRVALPIVLLIGSLAACSGGGSGGGGGGSSTGGGSGSGSGSSSGGSGGSSGSGSGGSFCSAPVVQGTCTNAPNLATASVCSDGGGTLVPVCPKASLMGCCSGGDQGAAIETCYYPPDGETASNLQGQCTGFAGTWSTSP